MRPYERHVNVNGTLAERTSGVTSSRLPRRIRRRRRLRPRCHHLCRSQFIVPKSVSTSTFCCSIISWMSERGVLDRGDGYLLSGPFWKEPNGLCWVHVGFSLFDLSAFIPVRKSCVRSIISRARATLDDEDHVVVRWRCLSPQVTRMRRPAWNETELDDVNSAFQV